MAHQNSSDQVTVPASGHLLRSAIAVALDRLRAWCRTEGVSWDQPADEDARLWRDLLMLTLSRMEDSAAPMIPLKVLTADSGIKLRKRTWEKHQNWFDRNMRVVLRRSLAEQGLPMIFPARASLGIRGHSTKSQAAYFLSFQDFDALFAVEQEVPDERFDARSLPNADDPLPLAAPGFAGQSNVGSATAGVQRADDGADAAGVSDGLMRSPFQEEAEPTATAASPGTPAKPSIPSRELGILSTLGLSLDAGASLTTCVWPLIAALALAMAISQVGEEISTATALLERVVTAIRDTLAGNVLPSFF